jgi:hypothetical protein
MGLVPCDRACGDFLAASIIALATIKVRYAAPVVRRATLGPHCVGILANSWVLRLGLGEGRLPATRPRGGAALL